MGLSRRLIPVCVAVFLVVVPFGVLLGLVDAHWAPLRHLDDDASRATHTYVIRHPELEGPLRATAVITHPWTFRLVVLVLVVWLAARDRRRAVWAGVTMVVAGVVAPSVKALVARPRPLLPEPIAHAPGTSFPSGHALGAAVGSAVIVVLLLPVLRGAWRWVAWTLAVLVTVATGAFRVLLGVHYASDVTAGWILGAAIVLATIAAFAAGRHDDGP
jgi:membrane-associated phospholipid phosphatase